MMKWLFVFSLVVFVSHVSFAQDATSKFSCDSGTLTIGSNGTSGQLDIGSSSLPFATLGQSLSYTENGVCLEYKDKGMCLVGPHDPYEMCRTQCVLSGTVTHTLSMKTKSPLEVTVAETLLTTAPKRKSKSENGKGFSCYRDDAKKLANNYLLIAKTADGKIRLFNRQDSTASPLDTKFDEFSWAPLKGGITANVAALIEFQDQKLFAFVDSSALKQTYDLSKAPHADCVSSYGPNSKFTLEVKDNHVVVKGATDGTEKDLGTLVTVEGQFKVALGDRLDPIKSLGDDTFILTHLFCHSKP